ncbi:hypothetical protein ACHQM5_010189 [Ranunculus cassubicifolius]
MAILSSSPSYDHLVFGFIALFVSAFLLLISRKSKSKKLHLPPGPPGSPFVGNFLQIARSGKSFFRYVEEMHEKYGPIFTLKMGARTMIFLGDANIVHEALIEKSQIFASRPAETPTRTIFSCDKFTVNSSTYGPVWRSLRRNMVQGMLSTTRLKEFRHVREAAMDKFIERIRVEAEINDGAVWVLKNARFAVFCILLAMCFGVEMDEKTIDKIDDLLKAVLLILSPRLDDYLPILSPFFAKQRKRVMEVREEQLRVLVPFIQKRRFALKNPGSDPTAAPFSYLDTLFDLKVEGRNSVPTDAELVTLCSELINGGTDTTATGLEWAIARLIENPAIQSRLYNEIKSTVGDRKVDEKDTEKMEYLNAFTKELLRKHPPTYFSLTHAVTEQVKLAGYDIPTDATIEIYLPTISDDPKLWNKPEVFDPDRFLSGKEEADMTGNKAVKMIPFGAGRRICPGLSMAMCHVNLMVARMVQEFEWSALPNQSKLDFTEKLEFTTVMKNTLQAIAKPRRK